MSINIKLLKQVCETPGTSGFEQKIRNLVIKEVETLCDKVSIDGMGNVIAFKKGKNDKKLMVPAHMDEIGFMVKFIDENGFIRVNPIGGFDPKTLTAQRMTIHGKEQDVVGVFGSKPTHIMSPEERRKPIQITDFHLETGYPVEKVNELISVGDPITRYQPLIEMGDCVNCKSLDNRVSVFILLEMMRQLETPPCDFYGVFTVQEEVGLRGAHVAANTINPDFSINLDTTIAFDCPTAKPEETVTKLGDGTAIKLMDSTIICDYRMVDFMRQTANKHKIKWQTEILDKGGTDVGAVQRMAIDGAICGGISLPTRNIHQSVEMIHKGDIQASIDLMLHCTNELSDFDWSHR